MEHANPTERSPELLIGILADAADVGVETIRFYERKGLLPEPPRNASGYRLYDLEALRRVKFIRKAKELGFTLAETKELLEACAANEETSVPDPGGSGRWRGTPTRGGAR